MPRPPRAEPPEDPAASPADAPADAHAIEAAILRLTAIRGPEKSICPSEAARVVAPIAWRDAMPAVRRVAARLVAEGRLRMLQKGRDIDPETARGPVRFAAKRFDD